MASTPTDDTADALAPWTRRVVRAAAAAARRLDTDRGAGALLALASLVYVVLAVLVTRGTGQFVDEIQLFAQDRGLRPSALLQPLNGHLVLVQRALYALDWRVFGGASYIVPKAVLIGGVVLVAWLLAALARRSVGPAAAALGAIAVLLLGSAWELNFVVSGLGNVMALAAGLGAFLAIERDDRRGDVLAAALLVLAVASFTLALALLLGIAVQLVLARGALRRLWVVLPALVAYLPWLLWSRATFDQVSMVDLANLPRLPQLVAREAASALGAFGGLDSPVQSTNYLRWFSTTSVFGPPLALAALVVLVVALVRRPAARGPRLWGALVALVAFWGLIALSVGPSRGTDNVRYTYAAAILLVLVAARVARGARSGPVVVLALAALTLVSLAGNLDRLRDASTVYRPASFALRATYSGLDAAGPAARPLTIAAGGPLGGLQVIEVRPYLRAAARYGTAGYSPAELATRPDADRAVADAALVRVEGLALRAGSASTEGCLPVPAATDGTRVLRVSSPGIRLVATGPATVGVRRFAAAGATALGSLQPGRGAVLALPSDASTRRWQVVVGAGTRSLAACPV